MSTFQNDNNNNKKGGGGDYFKLSYNIKTVKCTINMVRL